MVFFLCPRCQYSINSADIVGGSIECPGCHQEVSAPPGQQSVKSDQIRFRCPSCARKLKAPSYAAGRRGQCRFCKTRIVVPKPVAPEDDIPVETYQTRRSSRRTVVETNPKSDQESSLGAACPNCSRYIAPAPKRSRRCPHCNMAIYVRNHLLMSELQARHYEEHKAAELDRGRRNLTRKAPGAWTEQVTQERLEAFARKKDQLKNFRMFLMMGYADLVTFKLCPDGHNCAYCVNRSKNPVRITHCTLADLPPFSACEHEKRKLVTVGANGCRCCAELVAR